MGRRKHEKPKRESPIQLRPGPDLARLITEFAEPHGLPINEACKSLLALAVTTLDGRYFGLVEQLADALGGAHAYVRACTYIQGALAGGARARGYPYDAEAERSLFIVAVVREYLLARGRQIDDQHLAFLPQALQAKVWAWDNEERRSRTEQPQQQTIHERY